MVAYAATDRDKLAATLSAASGGALLTYDEAVMLLVLEADDYSCPIEVGSCL